MFLIVYATKACILTCSMFLRSRFKLSYVIIRHYEHYMRGHILRALLDILTLGGRSIFLSFIRNLR